MSYDFDREAYFFKFLKPNLKTFGDYEYKLGINIDKYPFSPTNLEGDGGLYFAPYNHIFTFHKYGSVLCVLKIPSDAQFHQCNYKMAKADKVEICAFLRSPLEIYEWFKSNDFKFSTGLIAYLIKYDPMLFHKCHLYEYSNTDLVLSNLIRTGDIEESALLELLSKIDSSIRLHYTCKAILTQKLEKSTDLICDNVNIMVDPEDMLIFMIKKGLWNENLYGSIIKKYYAEGLPDNLKYILGSRERLRNE